MVLLSPPPPHPRTQLRPFLKKCIFSRIFAVHRIYKYLKGHFQKKIVALDKRGKIKKVWKDFRSIRQV
jgi:hypothetical protein